MGWWEQDEQGHSFAVGSGLLWGDGPADAMANAVDDIREQFRSEPGREPTVTELVAGLLFHTGGREPEQTMAEEPE